jgi:hypothetical protein
MGGGLRGFAGYIFGRGKRGGHWGWAEQMVRKGWVGRGHGRSTVSCKAGLAFPWLAWVGFACVALRCVALQVHRGLLGPGLALGEGGRGGSWGRFGRYLT